MNATVPLEEVLPCSSRVARKILVCDSVETDGRFLLYTMSKQILAANGRVLWLVGSPVTENQVAMGLKKMGCEAAAAYLRDPNKNLNLNIRSLVSEIATRSLEEEEEKEEDWNHEQFLKEIYSDIKRWIQELDESSTPCWILLDDVSCLATLLGQSLVYKFIESCCAAASTRMNPSIGIMIRCSNTLDQQVLYTTDGDFEKDKSGWIGAGGLASRQTIREKQKQSIPWERSLAESVDGIVDVLPLTSGYSREAHGRIIFSEVPGARGWGQSNHTSQHVIQSTTSSATWNKLLFNYCIHDNGVRAIRLRV